MVFIIDERFATSIGEKSLVPLGILGFHHKQCSVINDQRSFLCYQ